MNIFRILEPKHLAKLNIYRIFAPLFKEMKIVRGRKVPSFYSGMLKNKVEELLQNALEERQDLFLISFSFGADNAIKVVIDGDKGVLVEDCMFISRAIEHNLDREEEDFSLEVLSAGAASPLTIPRQYKKNLGRDLEVKTNEDQNIEGQLVEADETSIKLTWKTREPKPVGKGKVTVVKEATIAIGDIKEAKVKIKF